MSAEILYTGNYSGSRSTTLHRHDGAELVLVTAGRCGNVVSGGKLDADTGQLFVIPPGLAHRQIDFGEVETTYLVFEPGESHFDFSFRVIDTARDAFVPVWIAQADTLYRQRATDECNTLLELLLRHLGKLERMVAGSALLPSAIAEALEYLAGHFSEPFSVAELAERHALSPSYFSALFRKHTDLSPAAYVQKLRFSYARRLLIGSKLPIGEVGELCGFDDTNYFVRLFRRKHGCTPGEYRSGGGAKAEELAE